MALARLKRVEWFREIGGLAVQFSSMTDPATPLDGSVVRGLQGDIEVLKLRVRVDRIGASPDAQRFRRMIARWDQMAQNHRTQLPDRLLSEIRIVRSVARNSQPHLATLKGWGALFLRSLKQVNRRLAQGGETPFFGVAVLLGLGALACYESV